VQAKAITRSPKSSLPYADHSVLASGRWAKIRVKDNGVHRLTDDFTPSQNFEGSGMTYHDFISALFGWTAKLPQRQINVFIRGDTLHIIQRGMEESVVDITNWPHAQPTIERKLVRSVWHGSHNDSNGAHNEEDTVPVPFTGTISFKEISRTYSNGFLVRETNENGYSTYSYDGEYLAEKRTHNVDGSTSRTDYAYASTGRDVYLFKEWERTTEAVNDGKKHTEYDWEDWSNEKGTERITYHAPLGYGWYATTVYVDGVLEQHPQQDDGDRPDDHEPAHTSVWVGAGYLAGQRPEPPGDDPDDVLAEVEQHCGLSAQLGHRGEGRARIRTVEEQLTEDGDMGAGGDREELRQSLHNPQHYGFQPIHSLLLLDQS